MSLDTAMKFYSLCQELKLTDFDDRLALCRLLVKEQKAGYIRDVEDYLKDKKALQIKLKRKPQ